MTKSPTEWWLMRCTSTRCTTWTYLRDAWCSFRSLTSSRGHTQAAASGECADQSADRRGLFSLLLADPLVRCEGCGEHVHPDELEAGHECYDGAHERR
jgi:hypothetical protein